MKNIDRRKIGILLIIISMFIFVGALIMYLSSSEEEKIIEKNLKLNEEQIIYLLKHVQKDLDVSSNLEINSFSDESMVQFALAYMEVVDEYFTHIKYDEENSIAITDVKYISEVAQYIFGVTSLNFEELGYKIEQDKIYIPINMQGGDVQIYKYKSTEYIESENAYVAYIDCLEMSGDIKHELLQESQTEYDENDVAFKMMLKYRLVGDRKILLSYNEISKYSLNVE